MSNSNSSKQILLSVIGVAILVVAVVGVSFAFFNYTRTGAPNTIKTGTISFNTSNSTITISNLFPIAKSDVATNLENVGVGTVTITGSTNYVNGIDFTVSVDDVSSNIGTTAGKLPISVVVTADENLSGVTAFGSNSGSMTLNSFEDGTTITSGATIASGRIPAGVNINGTITIKAYIDKARVAITDTYPEGDHYALNNNMSATELTACESNAVMSSGFTGTETAAAFCAGTGTRGGKTFQEHLDEGLFSASVIESLLSANVIKVAYTDGTTSTWVNSRTVLTTEEWNALSATPASFKITVVADEGAA